MTHKLKILPRYFQEVWDGNKNFELRKDDRDYKIGDQLRLLEYSHILDQYSEENAIELSLTFLEIVKIMD